MPSWQTILGQSSHKNRHLIEQPEVLKSTAQVAELSCFFAAASYHSCDANSVLQSLDFISVRCPCQGRDHER
jgi:hypothetical protein